MRYTKFTLLGLVLAAGLGYGIYHLYDAQWAGLGGKTAWDWLDLVVIPLGIALALSLYKRAQRRTELEVAESNNAAEQKVAQRQQWQRTFESYIDRMTSLILDNALLESADSSEVKGIARTRTMAALRSLNGFWRGEIVRFLLDAHVLQGSKDTEPKEANGAEPTDENVIRLSGANLREAELNKVWLRNTCLRESDFTGATLVAANVIDAELVLADFGGATLRGTNFFKSDMRSARFIGADLRGAQLQFANLTAAVMKKADARGSKFEGCDLSRATFEGADLSGEKTVLRRAVMTGTSLPGVNLSRADMSGAKLERCNMKGANLSGTKVDRAVFKEVTLTGADLRGTDFSEAKLYDCDLTQVRTDSRTKWPRGFNPTVARLARKWPENTEVLPLAEEADEETAEAMAGV